MGPAGAKVQGRGQPVDIEWKDAPGAVFLREARRLLETGGWTIVNVDVVVVIERPKILPYRERIREKPAEALGVEVGAVSVKAKTA